MRQVSEYQKITYLMRIIEFERLFSSRLFVLSEAQIIPSDLASTHYSILGEYITAVKKYKKEQGGQLNMRK